MGSCHRLAYSKAAFSAPGLGGLHNHCAGLGYPNGGAERLAVMQAMKTVTPRAACQLLPIASRGR